MYGKLRFNQSNNMYIGEVEEYNGKYAINGKGIQYNPDTKGIQMCEQMDSVKLLGMGYATFGSDAESILCFFAGDTIYGPCMKFLNEEYISFCQAVEYGNEVGYKVSVDYKTGNYVIFEGNQSGEIYRGLEFADGELNFVYLDCNGIILEKQSFGYIGTEYRFTTCRMFSMAFDPSRHIIEKNQWDKGGDGTAECICQVLNPSTDKLWGYGVANWQNGAYYFGEWYDGQREGIGCYKKEDGTRYLGKFYGDKISGNGMMINSEGDDIYFGNWKGGKKEGVFFHLVPGTLSIQRYENDRRVGMQYIISVYSETIDEEY